jgi:predicted nucleic acid-binding protein
LRGVREHKLNYYDALIWATARLNGLTYVLTEDGQDGRDLDGVRLVNPLREDFDLAWLR